MWENAVEPDRSHVMQRMRCIIIIIIIIISVYLML
jgi:t-SNARE complex subunit (syntaxin)